MRQKPGADRLHRNRFARELAALDQDCADGGVRSAVLRRVHRADDGSVVQDYPSRALDLQEEGVDGVVDEEYRDSRAQATAFDLRSARIRDQATIRHLTDDPLASEALAEEP